MNRWKVVFVFQCKKFLKKKVKQIKPVHLLCFEMFVKKKESVEKALSSTRFNVLNESAEFNDGNDGKKKKL